MAGIATGFVQIGCALDRAEHVTGKQAGRWKDGIMQYSDFDCDCTCSLHSADENLAIPHNSMKISHGEQRSRHKNRQVQRSVF